MDHKQQLVTTGAVCGLVGVVIGAAVFSNAAPQPPAPVGSTQAVVATEVPSASSPAVEPVAAEAQPAPPPTDWRITERVDPMTDQVIKTACSTSSNSVYLDAPYGVRSAQLCIRRHPKFGQDVYVALDGSGQIICRSYDSCTVDVRFDEQPVEAFSAAEPSDGSSETMFIVNHSRFVAAARKASRVRVQLEFYQNGRQTFDFPAKGLEW